MHHGVPYHHYETSPVITNNFSASDKKIKVRGDQMDEMTKEVVSAMLVYEIPLKDRHRTMELLKERMAHLGIEVAMSYSGRESLVFTLKEPLRIRNIE
jgi:phospholipid N-methyltransferase